MPRPSEDPSPPPSASARGHRHLVWSLLLTAMGMFGFGFLLVPLYAVFCEVTGLNGKTGGPFTGSEELVADRDRQVVVQFVAINNESMPWRFAPERAQIQVLPGVVTEVGFVASNATDRPMVAQAVPSVSPSAAARYFHKIQCFCFERQLLQSGETLRMPLQFVVDPELPAHIRKLTLSYTLFDITERQTYAARAGRQEAW